MRLTCLVEKSDLLKLTAVEDDGIVSKAVLGKCPNTILGRHLVIALYHATAHVAIEALWLRVVELQLSLQFLTLFGTRNEESGMTANLEEDLLVVGIGTMPDYMQFLTLQTISDG